MNRRLLVTLLGASCLAAVVFFSRGLDVQLRWRANDAQAIDLFGSKQETPAATPDAKPFWTESTGGPALAEIPNHNSFADLAEKVSPSVVSIRTSKTVTGRGGPNGMRIPPQLEPFFGGQGSPFEDFGGGQEYPGAEPGLGFRDLQRWLHRHQQPRRRGRRQDRGRVQGRLDTARRDHRPRSRDRHRADQGEDRQVADGASLRRLEEAATGRLGDRDRQSVRPRAHGDRGHRLGAAPPQHRRGSLRRLHPDRRGHQPGQLGRPADQPRGRGGRHQHRDQPARQHDRLRGTDRDGEGDPAEPQDQRLRHTRLARRRDPADHAGPEGRAEAREHRRAR